ncbi:hypothetical protein SDC9_210446 [bioreactor metagenome]|uniref:Uncharacterized protein n=1 Tax=bioreactor metagenome TaxID=1076179 RepID=A0A645JTU9_9ZZZZ
MRADGVYHVGRFLIFLGKIRADFYMGAFHLVVNRLADIVQQPCPFRQFCVRTDLGRHNGGEMCDFQRMLEYVLAVACAVTKSA